MLLVTHLMSACDDCRRGLLKAGIATAAVLLVPGCSSGHDDSGSGGGPPEAGADDASGDDGGTEASTCGTTCTSGTKTLEFTFAKYPGLKSVGGSANGSLTGYKDPSCGLDLIVVAQPTAGTYVAFSAGCPHQCCTVAYNKSHNEFLCPCHGSTFNTSGDVTNGPAPHGLQKLSVCADECAVYVTVP
jgi:nitrite reductase/ring-hydroxylating ferredoxin subunit